MCSASCSCWPWTPPGSVSLAGMPKSWWSRHSRGQRRQVSRPVGVTCRMPGRRSRLAAVVRALAVLRARRRRTAQPPQSSPLRATGSSARSRTIVTRSSNQLGGGRRARSGSIDSLDDDAAHEVGPHDAQRRAAEPRREAQERDPHRLELERVGRGHAPAPELELAQLEAVVGGAHGQVDPAADAQPARGRWAGRCRDRPSAPAGRRTPATYQRAACSSTARSSGSTAGSSRPPTSAKSAAVGTASSAWTSRTAARKASRSRDRCTGSWERSPPSNVARQPARAHRVGPPQQVRA